MYILFSLKSILSLARHLFTQRIKKNSILEWWISLSQNKVQDFMSYKIIKHNLL